MLAGGLRRHETHWLGGTCSLSQADHNGGGFLSSTAMRGAQPAAAVNAVLFSMAAQNWDQAAIHFNCNLQGEKHMWLQPAALASGHPQQREAAARGRPQEKTGAN